MTTITRIKGLVEKQANSIRNIDPWRANLIERGVEIEKGDKVYDDKRETNESYLNGYISEPNFEHDDATKSIPSWGCN